MLDVLDDVPVLLVGVEEEVFDVVPVLDMEYERRDSVALDNCVIDPSLAEVDTDQLDSCDADRDEVRLSFVTDVESVRTSWTVVIGRHRLVDCSTPLDEPYRDG